MRTIRVLLFVSLVCTQFMYANQPIKEESHQNLEQKSRYKRLVAWAKRNKKYSVPLAVTAASAVLFFAAKKALYATRKAGMPSTDEVFSLFDSHGERGKKVNLVYAHGYGQGYARGYGGSRYEVMSYFGDQGFDVHLFSPYQYTARVFDFPDVTYKGPAERFENVVLDVTKLNLGQEGDIARLKKAIEQTSVPILGMGCSRGAATWITTLGTHPELGEKIEALILESSFTTANEVFLRTKGKAFAQVPFAHAVLPRFLSYLVSSDYKTGGISPIKVASSMPTVLPMLFVHSHEERHMPINFSRELYIKVVQAGNTSAYLLELPTGHHANLLEGSSAHEYQRVVNTFLKQHGLPYDKNFAQDPQILKKLQPSVEEMRKRMVSSN